MDRYDDVVFWALSVGTYNLVTSRLRDLEQAELGGMIVERGIATVNGVDVRALVVDLNSPTALLGSSVQWVSVLSGLTVPHVVLHIATGDFDMKATARVFLVAEDGGLCSSEQSLAMLERIRASGRRGFTLRDVAFREGDDYSIELASPTEGQGDFFPLFERFERAGAEWALVDALVASRPDDPARAKLLELPVELVLHSLARRVPSLRVPPRSERPSRPSERVSMVSERAPSAPAAVVIPPPDPLPAIAVAPPEAPAARPGPRVVLPLPSPAPAPEITLEATTIDLATAQGAAPRGVVPRHNRLRRRDGGNGSSNPPSH